MPALNGSGFEGGEREEHPETTKGSSRELTRIASKKTSVGNVSRFMKEQPSVEQSVIIETTSEHTLATQVAQKDHVVCQHCQNMVQISTQKQNNPSIHSAGQQNNKVGQPAPSKKT